MNKLIFDITESDLEQKSCCIACKSTDIIAISDVRIKNGIKFFSTAICGDCSHVFRNLLPSEKWFQNNFRKRNDYQEKKGINRLNPLIEQDRYNRYLAIGNLLNRRYNNGGTILDVGCGPGTGLDALKEMGFKVEGIDSDESRSKIAKRNGHEIYEGEWKEYSPNKKLDFISSIHSLEHFHEPEDFLTTIKAWGDEETILYIEVPEVLDHVKDWNDSLYLAHTSNFNENSLVKLAAKCGWSLVEKVRPYSHTSLHQMHLSMLFKISDDTIEDPPVAECNKNLNLAILNAYSNNLTCDIKEFPLHFWVKEINDLSITFKRNTYVRRKVHDNYNSRTLIKKCQNHFEVS